MTGAREEIPVLFCGPPKLQGPQLCSADNAAVLPSRLVRRFSRPAGCPLDAAAFAECALRSVVQCVPSAVKVALLGEASGRLVYYASLQAREPLHSGHFVVL